MLKLSVWNQNIIYIYVSIRTGCNNNLNSGGAHFQVRYSLGISKFHYILKMIKTIKLKTKSTLKNYVYLTMFILSAFYPLKSLSNALTFS